MIGSANRFRNSALMVMLSAMVLASTGCSMLGGGKFRDAPLFKNFRKDDVSIGKANRMPGSLSRADLDNSDDDIPIYQPKSIQRPTLPGSSANNLSAEANSQFTSSNAERRTIIPVSATEEVREPLGAPRQALQAPIRQAAPAPIRRGMLPLSSRPYTPMMPMTPAGGANC